MSNENNSKLVKDDFNDQCLISDIKEIEVDGYAMLVEGVPTQSDISFEDACHKLYPEALFKNNGMALWYCGDKYIDARSPHRVKIKKKKCQKIFESTKQLENLIKGFSKFPSKTKELLEISFNDMGSEKFKSALKSTKFEIIISESLPHPTSIFGHVAVNVGGITLGRTPTVWDARTISAYLAKQQSMRASTGYVINVSDTQRDKILASVFTKIVENKKYGVDDHSCSNEIIRSFGDAGINVVDPRWSIPGVYSPKDMMNYLDKSSIVEKINQYPHTPKSN